MLKMELKYWGIDENLFKDRSKNNNFEIIQELLDTPVLGIFERTDDNEFFHKNL